MAKRSGARLLQSAVFGYLTTRVLTNDVRTEPPVRSPASVCYQNSDTRLGRWREDQTVKCLINISSHNIERGFSHDVANRVFDLALWARRSVQQALMSVQLVVSE